MKKNTSVKGEYGIGVEMAGSAIRDLQSLLNSRRNALNMNENNGFGGQEHKMEMVKNIRGVDFINDAASTNANGVYMALSNMQKKLVWITNFEDWGGVGELVGELLPLVQNKVAYVVFMGNENSPSRFFLEGLGVNSECVADIESAVRAAFYSAGIHQAVLYCPGNTGGASISQRGNAFKSAVAQL